MPALTIYETLEESKVLPKIVEKIFEEKKRVLLLTPTHEEALFFDQLLWTYTPLSFLAHGCEELDTCPSHHPLWIASIQESSQVPEDWNPNSAHVLFLVNFFSYPLSFDCFERVILLTSQEDASLHSFTSLFQEVSFWKKTPQGWEKKAF